MPNLISLLYCFLSGLPHGSLYFVQGVYFFLPMIHETKLEGQSLLLQQHGQTTKFHRDTIDMHQKGSETPKQKDQEGKLVGEQKKTQPQSFLT